MEGIEKEIMDLKKRPFDGETANNFILPQELTSTIYGKEISDLEKEVEVFRKENTSLKNQLYEFQKKELSKKNKPVFILED